MSEYIYRRERIADGVYSAENTGIEIVRCRNCKHYEYWEFKDGRTAHDCARGGDYVFDTEPDGFCAWGEQKQ